MSNLRFPLDRLARGSIIILSKFPTSSTPTQAVKKALIQILTLKFRAWLEDLLSISTEASDRFQFWQAVLFIQYLLYGFIFLFSVSGVFSSWLSKQPVTPKDWAFTLQEFASWHTNWGPAVIVIAVGALTVIEAYRRFNDPWKWKAIQSCLDGLSQVVFAGAPYQDGFEHEHRITTFRLQRGCLQLLKPCTERWFVPIARSGSLKKKTRSIFRYSDNPKCIEGIVGRAWCQPGKWYQPSHIPELSSSMTPQAEADYVNKTNYSIDKARAKRYDARSYAAITMELRGNLWGVLVLDSTCDTTPNMKAAKTFAKYFRLFISSVTPLLEAL
jgi:hypothetical protein